MDCNQELEKQKESIARELHDNIGQLLSLTRLYFERALKEMKDPDGILEQSWQYLNYTISAFSNLTLSLNTPQWIDNGLVQEINRLVTDINKTGRFDVLAKIGSFNEDMISPDQKITAYRIIQELLNNAIKHSKAKNIVVRLLLHDELLHLSVEDDGVGFDIEKNCKGFGLNNINHRVAAYKGRINITSSPAGGCLTEIILPANEIDK